MNVFLVEHDHAGDKKNIGLFSNFSKVQYAIDKLSNVEGFEDYTEGFNTIKLKVDYYYDFNEIIKRESFGSDKSFEEDRLINKCKDLILLQHCYDLDKDENTMILGVFYNWEWGSQSNRALSEYLPIFFTNKRLLLSSKNIIR